MSPNKLGQILRQTKPIGFVTYPPREMTQEEGSSTDEFMDGRVHQWEYMRDTFIEACFANNPNFTRAYWFGYLTGEKTK